MCEFLTVLQSPALTTSLQAHDPQATHSIENTREGGRPTQPQTQVGGCTSFAPSAVWFNADPARTSCSLSYTQKPTASWVPQRQNHRQLGRNDKRAHSGAGAEASWETKGSTTVHGVGWWGGLYLDMCPPQETSESCFQEGTSDSTAQSTEEHSEHPIQSWSWFWQDLPGAGAGREGAPSSLQ